MTERTQSGTGNGRRGRVRRWRCRWLLPIVGAALSAQAGCTRSVDRLSVRIGEALEDRSRTSLDLTDLTDFAWDEVHVFEPYQPRASICEEVGIDPADCARVVPIESSDDGTMTLVFVAEGEVVEVARHERQRGDFLPLVGGSDHAVLGFAEATFRVDRSSVDCWGRLVWPEHRVDGAEP